jgi:hypothetical protein
LVYFDIFLNKKYFMDVVVKDKKTGEEKILPEKVYENLKHRYKLIGSLEDGEEEIKKKAVGLKEHAEVVVNEPSTISQQSLSDEYAKLSGGKKPDGRWSEEKLKKQIDDLKKTIIV